MTETIIGMIGFLIGIAEVANGVAAGWIFVIIGALFMIKQGVKNFIRTNKTNNGRNNEQSPHRKKAIPSHKELKSTHYEKSGSRSEKSLPLVKEGAEVRGGGIASIDRPKGDTLDDDRTLPVGKERGIEGSEKPDKQISDPNAASSTSDRDEESFENEVGTDRKTESIIHEDKTESKAVTSDINVGSMNNLFGFRVSKEDIQRVGSVDPGTITVREDPEYNTIWLILEYKGNVNLVSAIDSFVQTLRKYREDAVIESIYISEIHDMYEPRINEHFSLTVFQKAVKENKTLLEYGLGGYGEGYPISELSSAWFPATVVFSVDDIEATVGMRDGSISLKCCYNRKASQHIKLSADDIGAGLIFESIVKHAE